MSDFRVKVTVRNARLLRAIESLGHNPSSFAKAHGFHASDLCGLVAMTKRPVDRNGDWRPCVVKLCELANRMPADLFTARQMDGWERNSSEIDVHEAALEAYHQDLVGPSSDDVVIERDLADRVNVIVDRLPARSAAILRANVEGATLREIGAEHGIKQERVRQILFKAERDVRRMAQHHGLTRIYGSA